MKYLDEYRDARLVHSLAAELARRTRHPWVLMEICGGQTHTLMRYGIDELLPPTVELVHGPGCPVCVTPLETIDKALALAARREVTLVSYGDMLRVPGSTSDLFRVRATGGDVRVVYSPMEAVWLARAHPERQVVFFGIGFETTAPANALAVWRARQDGLRNFFLLSSHVLVPPAIRLLLRSPQNRVQGFIAPGHVCTVMGSAEYAALSREFHVPFVIGGFEPVDLLQAILLLVTQLEEGRAEVENPYGRSVREAGNPPAKHLLEEVFEVCDRKWRGLGAVPRSGLRLRPEFGAFDAEKVFRLEALQPEEPAVCISAQVLQGLKKPVECPAFARECTPATPLGAPMVSAEGACAAYYQYRRHTVSLAQVSR